MAFPAHAREQGGAHDAQGQIMLSPLLWTHNHKVSGDTQASLRERAVEQAGTRKHFAPDISG